VDEGFARGAAGPGVELVIFDCDGVLVDTEGISSEIMAEMLAAEGWELSPPEARERFLGWALPAVEDAVAGHVGHPLPPDWLDVFQERRAEAFRSCELRAVDGAEEAVRGLIERGIEVCVASNAILEKTQLTLGLTGLLPLFSEDRLFSRTMVARGKPHPDLFLHAAAVCGAAPAQSVVVEDSPTGVTAGRAAGMRVLAYAGDGGAEALVAAGGEIVTDLRAVPALLG
jgi:HAD superfamily hydrolase (TIGR01509 family)